MGSCRANELSKERSKEIETSDSVNALQNQARGKKPRQPRKDGKDAKQPKRKRYKCTYCGTKHERKKCPAFGKECTVCHKLNHFASVCKTKQVGSTVHSLADGNETDTDYDEILTVDLEPAQDIHALTDAKFPKRIFATLDVGRKPVKFQLDSGASCNVISAETLQSCLGQVKLNKTTKVLSLYNQTTVKPVGQCTVELHNRKTDKSYQTEFVVIEERSTPLLGSETIQHMDLIHVRFENILLIDANQRNQPLTKSQLVHQYADVFEGTGNLKEPYHLEVDPYVKPVIHAPRKVPLALKTALKEELDRLESLEILTPVTEPTPWVSSLVTVRKPNGSIRVCIDPKDLNKALKRSHYPLPTIDDILPEVNRAKIFSTFDVKNGFWHVELDDESSKLTCFNTPFGRYRWLRLPFGLSSAPEEFQRRQHQVLEGLPGVLTIHDDILVYGEGETYEEASKDHDAKLHKLMERCRERNVKLNKDKMKLRLEQVPYIGHLLTSQGLKPDPDKVKAILEMPKPVDVAAVRRFIGFVNYLSKFLPRLSEVCEPLRRLTMKDVEWHWTHDQEEAFNRLKQLVTEAPVLKYFEPSQELTLQSDACDTGLGAVLTQNGQPIAFASRALSDAETRYAQIEKELLAIVFGLEKFHQYTYGRPLTVQSDHKPLEVIYKKPLQRAPKRLQRLLLRLLLYDVTLVYRCGKQMELADTLSRAYLPYTDPSPLQSQVEAINMAQDLPVSAARLEDVRKHTEQDETLQEVTKIILSGWPEQKSDVPSTAASYFNVRDELSIQNGVVFCGERAVVPKSLRKDMLQRIHASHLGIEGCLRRARECLYWPGMNSEVKDFIQQCEVCRSTDVKQQKEPLQPHDIPTRQWAKVAVDLFVCNRQNYLIIVDYYSGFWEIEHLDSTVSSHVIRKMKMHFARYGIPDVVMSDNGPQFASEEYKRFSKTWKFELITSSPHHPRSNGKAENAVKAAKRLMMKAKKDGSDVYLALLDYRNTPTQGLETSPVQRLMSRRTKTLLPTTAKLLQPQIPDGQHKKMLANQERQAKYYDRGARTLPDLKPGDTVRMYHGPSKTKSQELLKAMVNSKLGSRSYEVLTEDGRNFRRNRVHLRKSEEEFQPNSQTTSTTNGDSTPQPASTKSHPQPVSALAPATSDLPAVTNGHTQGHQEPVAPPKQSSTSQCNTQNQVPTTRSGRPVTKPRYLKDFV